MEISAYCLTCEDNNEHEVKKMTFYGKKIEVELDCGHTMIFWGTAVTKF